MKNIISYLIICFGVLSYNENKNTHNDSFLLKINKDNIISDSKDTIPYLKVMNEFISQEKKEELVEFCDLFVEIIQTDDIEKVKTVIDFPIWVECFKDFNGYTLDEEHYFTFGDTITVDNFFQYRNLIFDDIFFKTMREKIFLKDEMFMKEFDIENSFFILTQYQCKYYLELGIGGKTRLFRFEKRKNKYKLVLVFCAG
jgi:hypothetical protein